MATSPGSSVYDASFYGDSGYVPLLQVPPVQPVVALYNDPAARAGNSKTPQFAVLPNVRLVSDQSRDGAAPTVARYRYDFNDAFGPAFPRRVEDTFGRRAGMFPYTVLAGARVVSLIFLGYGPAKKGSRSLTPLGEVINDGFLVSQQANVGDGGEAVTFECIGTPIREWDSVLKGAVYRHADKTGDPGYDGTENANDFQTGLPVRFNPDGQPNAVPESGESTYAGIDEELKYPVFSDPLAVKEPDTRRHWTLGMAVRYILVQGNKEEEWTRLPANFADLGNVLGNLAPAVPGGPVDLDDPATYVFNQIQVPDIDITGLPWPDAVARVIGPFGFGIRFELEQDSDMDISYRLVVYRKDTDAAVKPVYTQSPGPGVQFDLNLTNATAYSFQEDNGDIVNQVTTRTRPNRVEASFVLSPLFEVSADDATTPEKFKKSEGDDFSISGNNTKYRLFGIDETGDGHWDFTFGSFVTDELPDLQSVFVDKGVDVDGGPAYVHRRRPAVQGEIFQPSGGPAGTSEPLDAELWVSTDYDGSGAPGPWFPGQKDQHWQKISNGGWKLCDDRLGIILTMPDPSSWSVGRPEDGTDMPFPGGKINVLKSIADPDTGDSPTNPRLYFRLTCVVEGDAGIDLVAERQPCSPTRFTVERQDDSSDTFKKDSQSRVSQYVAGDRDSDNRPVEDDTDRARDSMESRRRAHELGSFGGSFTIPYITDAYRVGDKVSGVVGRGISFNQVAGAGVGESPVYPSIVGRDRTYEPQQTSTFHLGDLRMEGMDLQTSANHEFTSGGGPSGTATIEGVEGDEGGEGDDAA